MSLGLWDMWNAICAFLLAGFSTPAHLDGLLHLSALTSAVTIGYVGLDRIRVQFKEDEGALERSIARQTGVASALPSGLSAT